MYEIVAIGNAILDIVCRCDDRDIIQIGAIKGHMNRLTSSSVIDKVYLTLRPGLELSGGSAANVAAGVASMGGESAHVTLLPDNDLGAGARRALLSEGVDMRFARSVPGRRLCRMRYNRRYAASRFMPHRARVSVGGRAPTCGIKRSQLQPLEEAQELVVWSVFARLTHYRMGLGQDGLFERKVRIEVDLRSVERLVPQPDGDHRAVDAGLE